MSRKAGTPNKPKSIDVSQFNKELIQNEIEQKFVRGIKEEKQTKDIPEYLVVQTNDIDSLNQVVRAEMACYKYQCQGGVSVTNYRGLDGNIVMVYCQALIKKG